MTPDSRSIASRVRVLAERLGLLRRSSDAALPTDIDPLRGFTADELRRAALELPGVFMGSPDNSFWGGTVAKADAYLESVERLRARYADYEPKQLRNAVMDWCDYYEHRGREARCDCETGTARRRANEYSERSARERRRVAELLKCAGNARRDSATLSTAAQELEGRDG